MKSLKPLKFYIGFTCVNCHLTCFVPKPRQKCREKTSTAAMCTLTAGCLSGLVNLHRERFKVEIILHS